MSDIADTVLALVSTQGVEVEERDLLIQAIELARDRNVDFVDAFLAAQAVKKGETVCTFDEHDFKRLPATWLAPE